MPANRPNYTPPPPPKTPGSIQVGRDRLNVVTKSILIAIIILAFAVGLWGIVATFTGDAPTCWNGRRSVACLDERVQECVALETYSRAECIELVGGQP